MSVVEAIEVTKKYQGKIAVDGISFEVSEGECFGILGPNGAGKTSLFKMMYGSSEITKGELFIYGMNAREHMDRIKSEIGVLPQEDGLDSDFSVFDNLMIYGSYHRIPNLELRKKCQLILQKMRLEEYANRSVEHLSGGMKRRLAIARATINDPKLLLLDEPTTGLDPQARQWAWDELRDMNENGKTMILTTHYMEEAEELCDRIIIMSEGKVVAHGTPHQLITEHIGREVIEFEVLPRELDYHVNRIKDRYAYQVRRNRVQLHIRDKVDIAKVLSEIHSESIVVRKASLNDVFLKIAGHELRD